MTNDEIIEAVKKLQYQVSVVAETINYLDHPIESLILSMNWDSVDINKAHDIFEKWENLLNKGEKMNSAEFEHDFNTELEISYQSLKSVILAFYRNGQWTTVCEAYVDSFGEKPAVEYHSIMQRKKV